MLGGIIFVIVVWFLPLGIWYFVQGRKQLSSTNTSCEISENERKWTKRSFYGALAVGILIIILIIIFG